MFIPIWLLVIVVLCIPGVLDTIAGLIALAGMALIAVLAVALPIGALALVLHH